MYCACVVHQSRFTEDQLLQHARDLGYVPDDSWTREVAERTLMQHYIDAHHKANEAEVRRHPVATPPPRS